MEKLQLPLKNISTVFPSKLPKGNAELIFLCNTQKSLVKVCPIKLLKKHCHKKVSVFL